MFAGNFAPSGWALCDGQQVDISSYPDLYAAIGTTYGGAKSAFNLPDMRGRVPVHRGSGFSIGEAGGSELGDVQSGNMPSHDHTSAATTGTVLTASGTSVALVADPRPITTFAAEGFASAAGGDNAHSNMQPFLSLHFIIALSGSAEAVSHEDPLIGEVRIFAGRSVPAGWKRCDGQQIDINDNPALFAALGTLYGGDGLQTFAVPDLRERVAVHAGQGDGLTLRRLGEAGGSAEATLKASQLPYHTHQVTTSGTSGTLLVSDASSWPGWSPLAAGPDAVSAEAGHNNMQPYLVLNYLIATRGQTPA